MSTFSQYSYYQAQPSLVHNHGFSATHQGGMTWNGSEWVMAPAATPAAPFPGSYAQFGINSIGVGKSCQQPAVAVGSWNQQQQQHQSPQQAQQLPQQPAAYSEQSATAPPPAPPTPPGHSAETSTDGNAEPDALVARYSLYYQSWKAQADEQRTKAAGLPPGPERDEAQRMAQWADYYADQASRSAHHFNRLVHQSKNQQQQQHEQEKKHQREQQKKQQHEQQKKHQHEQQKKQHHEQQKKQHHEQQKKQHHEQQKKQHHEQQKKQQLEKSQQQQSPPPSPRASNDERNDRRLLLPTTPPKISNGNEIEQQQAPTASQTPKRKSRWSDRTSTKTGVPTVTNPVSSPRRLEPLNAADTTVHDDDVSPPEGLKRYVHRCLVLCTTDAQRALVQVEIERIISEKIRDGTMQAAEWDRMEPIAIPTTDDRVVVTDAEPPTQVSSSSSSLSPDSPRSLDGTSPDKGLKRDFGWCDENLPANDRNYSGGLDGDKKFGSAKHHVFMSLTGKEGGTHRRDPSNRKRKADARYRSSKFGSEYDQDLPINDSYYGDCRLANDGSSSVCSDERSKGSGRGRGDLGSLASEQDFISLSSSFRKQDKRKPHQQKKAKHTGQKHKEDRWAAYQRKDSSASTESGTADGFERSHKALAARASRFSGRGGIADVVGSSVHSGVGSGVDRYMGKGVISGSKKVLDETDYERMTVKGTCELLEKDYLRLTSPPRAELVRPKPILEKHLTNLKKLWGKAENDRGGNGKRDYLWFCSQFKAIRQDLTVQRIFDPFAIEVYETHARIALEKGDLNEYNQCQTQLKELYDLVGRDSGAVAANSDNESLEIHEEQLDGKKKKNLRTGLENQHEFVAYRIIYYVYLTGNKKYEGGSSDLFKIMLSLTLDQRENPVIAHALRVRVAFAENDYHTFFSLHDSAPNMSAYLMDYLVPQVRQAALQRMHKAYRPSVPTRHVLKELGFDVDDVQEVKEGRRWLLSCGCKLVDDDMTFLTKDSFLKESDLVDKKSSLI